MTKLANSNAAWWIFAICIVVVYFYGLSMPLVGPDEPRYAQVAREMFERGDWISPTLGGFDWFEKPALLYWLQIVGYKLFGVNEFAARFGSALFGLGTIASMWIFGRYSNFRSEKAEAVEFATWLALIAATTLGILVFSRGASFDIIVTFPLTASLVGFFVSDCARSDQKRQQTLGLIAFYFFAGLAVLAKGLIGVVFPFGTVFAYFVFCRRWPSRQFLVSILWGTVLLMAVAAVWNVPMYLRHGWKFIDEFYIQHHFQRYTSNKYQHLQPFYFYVWVLPLMTLPWLPFFIASIWRLVKEVLNSKNVETPDRETNTRPLQLFALAWIAVPVIFFSLSGSKLPGYILPALPGTGVLTGIFVFEFVRRSAKSRALVFSTAAAMLIAVVVLVTFVVPKYADRESVKRLIGMANNAGYKSSKVVNLQNISHNAEFYAAGRLVREADGKQLRFNDAKELGSFVSSTEEPVLALVPVEKWADFLQSGCYASDRIGDNGDLAIVALTKTSVPCS